MRRESHVKWVSVPLHNSLFGTNKIGLVGLKKQKLLKPIFSPQTAHKKIQNSLIQFEQSYHFVEFIYSLAGVTSHM